jgi:hypothetical protein
MNGRLRTADFYNPIGVEPYRDLLKSNVIGMHGAVMYDRAQLIGIDGFDPALRRCEDYDVYLRLSRAARVASHPEIVAEYRWHGGNISLNHRDMLEWSLRVHGREAGRARETAATARDWRIGRTGWRELYVSRMLDEAKRHWRDHHAAGAAVREVAKAVSAAPLVTARSIAAAVRRRIMRPSSPRRAPGPASGADVSPPRGSVGLGALDRTTPVSTNFGFDRGTPVDRHYVERFLEHHAAQIAGSVLEVGSDDYCRRFGASRINHQDVLDLGHGSAAATIVGDLCDPRTLPDARFDCIVLTQTLQFVFDMRAAVAQLHRALRPGGVVLATVPGIGPIDRTVKGAAWCWALSPHSAHRLFASVFGPERVRVMAFGNVYAATAFLHGLAVEELDATKLDVEDPAYPVNIGVCAQKAVGASAPKANASTMPAAR